MNSLRQRGIELGPVALGWVVAILVGIVLALVLGGIFGVAAGGTGPAVTGQSGAGLVIGSLIFGFLAYLAGGYVAGNRANTAKPLNGAMTAVLNLVIALVLAIIATLLILIIGGSDFPPGPVGALSATGGGFLGVLIGFLVNLAGGYVGGKLAEPRGR
jgi:hypothetical protein